jgi:hypothetical protein
MAGFHATSSGGSIGPPPHSAEPASFHIRPRRGFRSERTSFENGMAKLTT